MLDSGSYENQVWGALHKAWKGYVIAKNKGEYDKMEHYARIIQECQYDLRLEVSSFDNIGMPASSFLWHIAQKKKNNNKGQEVSREEDLTDHQHEQERFTYDNAYTEYLTDNGKIDKEEMLTDDNTNSEYFRDDYNKADRFTS
jgi:hypothetical protein